ncbi:hypothetical protein, partial [Klebsiella pneumoniae]|uniref:hypothetical protein n=1 Tax=Klebsiella pneumoniae TaxID=573 RepID=UPI001C8F7810
MHTSRSVVLNVLNAPVADKFDVFFDIFKYDFDVCFPKVKSRLRGEKNWVTKDIITKRVDVLELSNAFRNLKDKS